jgi:hypothetical protein
LSGYGSGSMPVTNGSEFGSCYFRHWPSRWQQKTNFFNEVFLLITFWRYIHIGKQLLLSNDRNRVRSFRPLQDGASHERRQRKFVWKFPREQPIETTANPPLFSLVNTFNVQIQVLFGRRGGGGSDNAWFRARIFKLFVSPRIDSKKPIPPGCVAWRAGMTNLFLLGSWPHTLFPHWLFKNSSTGCLCALINSWQRLSCESEFAHGKQSNMPFSDTKLMHLYWKSINRRGGKRLWYVLFIHPKSVRWKFSTIHRKIILLQ